MGTNVKDFIKFKEQIQGKRSNYKSIIYDITGHLLVIGFFILKCIYKVK